MGLCVGRRACVHGREEGGGEGRGGGGPHRGSSRSICEGRTGPGCGEHSKTKGPAKIAGLGAAEDGGRGPFRHEPRRCSRSLGPANPQHTAS